MRLLCQILCCVVFISFSYASEEVLLLPLNHSDVDSITLMENNELIRENLKKAYYSLGTVILLNKSKYNCLEVTCAKKWGNVFQVNWVFFPKILRVYREWVIQGFLIDIKADTVYSRAIPIPYGIYKLEDIVKPMAHHFMNRTINKTDWENDEWIDSVEVILKDSSLVKISPKIKSKIGVKTDTNSEVKVDL